MGMSTQRKVCGAVLALAGVAFVVDRWVIGPGPSAAQAEQTPAGSPAGDGSSAPAGNSVAIASPSAGARGAAAAAASDKPAIPGRSLASRLQEATAAERLDLAIVADAFQPSRLWAIPKAPAATVATPTQAGPKIDPAAEFRSRHKLTAVIKSDVPGGGLAMIDNKTVVPGESPEWLDGFEMVWVRDGRAMFRHDGVEVELRLEESKLKKDAGAR